MSENAINKGVDANLVAALERYDKKKEKPPEPEVAVREPATEPKND
jgi:hypothetical protein